MLKVFPRVDKIKLQVQGSMWGRRGSLCVTCCCIHRMNKKTVAIFIKTLNCPSHLPPSYHLFYLHFSSSTLIPCTRSFLQYVPLPFVPASPAPSCPPFFHWISFCPHALHSLLLFILHPPSLCSLQGPWQC